MEELLRWVQSYSGNFVPRSEIFTFQLIPEGLTNYIYFVNPARRPQSRKGRLAADALRRRRDGVKEDYYV
jgi:hypothetical protein